ncbi:MAG: hypothetical protein VX529_06235 [Pseudomonadota bacterium]|nr:hypothetical protein [Pseudomonadota bacterium]
MAASTDKPLSPTVSKVLDEYLAALHADDDFENEMADRLDSLLRRGKAPKPDEIDAALFPPKKGGNS